MNPLIIIILILGAVCLGLIAWLYGSRMYYEGQIEKCEKVFNVLAKNAEIEMKRLTDELKQEKERT